MPKKGNPEIMRSQRQALHLCFQKFPTWRRAGGVDSLELLNLQTTERNWILSDYRTTEVLNKKSEKLSMNVGFICGKKEINKRSKKNWPANTEWQMKPFNPNCHSKSRMWIPLYLSTGWFHSEFSWIFINRFVVRPFKPLANKPYPFTSHCNRVKARQTQAAGNHSIPFRSILFRFT